MAEPNKRSVFVVGVGMTKFVKPLTVKNLDYPDMIKEAVEKCLKDSNLTYDKIQHASVGYVFGDSACGQKGLYQLGMTGIPIVNLNNNCATGSSALYLAKKMIEGGLCDCTLALGFEKMEKGSLMSKWRDRVAPLQSFIDSLFEIAGLAPAPITAQLFNAAGREHMEKYGTTKEHFAKIAQKNHKHSINNPNSQSRQEYSLEEILNSKTVHDLLTIQQCCPTSDGAAAVILASEKFVREHNLFDRAIEVAAIQMSTDREATFSEKNAINLVGSDMTKLAADRAYQEANIRPTDVDVIELHDCFSINELITYEALGLCPVGKAKDLIDAGDNTYGGKYVINPSGGLISKGHPLGATGIAQCCELTWQLRNEAGARQVKDAKVALQHNLGLGGAAVVAIYKKPSQQQSMYQSKL